MKWPQMLSMWTWGWHVGPSEQPSSRRQQARPRLQRAPQPHDRVLEHLQTLCRDAGPGTPALDSLSVRTRWLRGSQCPLCRHAVWSLPAPDPVGLPLGPGAGGGRAYPGGASEGLRGAGRCRGRLRHHRPRVSGCLLLCRPWSPAACPRAARIEETAFYSQFIQHRYETVLHFVGCSFCIS